ncbi:MAG: hypothetical protein GY950_01865, partial [bacterium]|nr:hypothetical protein [bacterium]
MGKYILSFFMGFICLFLVFASGENGENVRDFKEVKPQNIQIPAKAVVKPDLNFGKFPLYFITNKGQVNKKARFYAKASRYTLWLTKEGLVFDSVMKEGRGDTARDVSGLMFIGANKNPEIIPFETAKLKVNYFKGNNKSKWFCDVPTSRAVLYKNLYKNIDLKVYGIEKQIEYDWIVKPGGNPEDIRFEYKHVKGTRLDAEGNLLIESDFGELMHKKPVAYLVDGRRPVAAAFHKITQNTYGFAVGAYDKNHELIIDPVVLAYSTYLGGDDAEMAYAIAVDDDGCVYVAGYTDSTDFPILGQYMSEPGDDDDDTFVTKIDTTKSGAESLVYSTYLGGANSDTPYGIAADGTGNVYVAGLTVSADFPIFNQYQGYQGGFDGYVVRLDTNLGGASSLIYSTYLGGESAEQCEAVAVDGNGHAYVTGWTWSTDFPVLNQYQVFQGSYDAFVTRLDTNQGGESGLIYSTCLGGERRDEGFGIAVDAGGNAYVTGWTFGADFPVLNQYQGFQGIYDAFVTRVDTNQEGGSSLIYSTYLGGESGDQGQGIAVDAAGCAYVTGFTESGNFPVLNQYQGFQGSYDAFVTRLDTNREGGASLIYSTCLGGQDEDKAYGIALDLNNNAYVTGHTAGIDFPIRNQYQGDPGDSKEDVFVTRLDTGKTGDSSLIYSTYLGGAWSEWGYAIAVDGASNVYVTGFTGSWDFPVLNQYQSYHSTWDAFVTKFTYAVLPTVTTASVSAITTTSASCGGDVILDGGAPVTARGVCCSTSENPTTTDAHSGDGTGTGTFSSSMTGLTPNTVYYVRAYAVNAAGTAYGNQETFETDDPSITVTYPNGGEYLTTGSGQNITWTSDGVPGNVKIEYSVNNGVNWTDVAASTENDGIHPWTVPAAPSYLCFVRVSEIGGGTSDVNDNVFTIAVSSNAIPLSEREALIALYNDARGFQWLNKTNWKKQDGNFNDPGTEYTWHG